ncbi:MAG: hypothetical protein DRP08_04255 [Candidatus Aenigmatarchaeota archaeon]|nr:MAG: hypothetical protein DRP08_04255 [Candidatus Aenigmarchaeota archaeon]
MVVDIKIKKCEHDCDKIIHISKTPQTDPVSIKAFVIKQKEKHIFFTGIDARVLDMMCDIPSINFKEWSNRDIAEKALTAKGIIGFNWQRELDLARIDEIHDFFDQDENYIVNPVIISLRDPQNIPALTKDQNFSIITFNISPWMKNKCPECGMEFKDESGNVIYQDRCSKHDCRRHETSWQPAVVIDGQHRIRGIPYRKGNYVNELIPTIILPPTDYDEAKQAKLFTEITTKAVDLHKLHKMLLQYRFNIPPLDNKNNIERRWAYEICLYLNCIGDIYTNPVFDKISIVPKKTGFISADKAVPVLKNYYYGCLNKYINNPAGAAELLKNYFEAVKNTWPDAWSRSPHGWLNQRGIFKVLLELFDTIYERVKRWQNGRFTESNFRAELSYGKIIAWGKDPAWDKFISPDKHLRILSNILRERYKPTIEKPDFSDINKYITQAPDDPHLKIVPKGKIRDGTKIKWKPPINAFSTPEIKLTQGNRTYSLNITPVSVSRNAEIILRERKHFYSGQGDLTIEIEFRNHTQQITKKIETRPT